MLILQYVSNTDSPNLVNSDIRHAQLGEEVLRMIVREFVVVLV